MNARRRSIGALVAALVARRTPRPDQPAVLVVPDRAGRDARALGQLADRELGHASQHALTSSSLQLVQSDRVDNIDRLLTLMTGDEKHDARRRYSTLDVLRVLYERVLDVSPETRRRPASRPVPAVEGARPDGLLRRALRPRLLPRVLARRPGRRSTRRSGTTPTATWCPASRSRRGSLGHGLPLAVGTALGLRAQGHRARGWSCSSGDAELDEGSNHEALELAAALGLDALTVVVVDNRSSVVRRPGPDRRALRHRGLAGRRPSTAATTTRWRRRCPTAASAYRTPSSPPCSTQERGGGEHHDVLTRDPRTQFARTVTDLLDEDLSTALVCAEISARFFGEADTPAPRPRRQRRHPRAAARQRRRRDGADRAAADRAHLRHVPGRARLRAGEARLRPPGRRRRAGRGRRLVRRRRRRPYPPGAGRRRADGHAARRRRSTRPAPRPRPTRCSAARSRPTGCTTCGSSSRPTASRSPAPACTSYAVGRAPPWSRSGRCSTRCSTRPRTAT